MYRRARARLANPIAEHGHEHDDGDDADDQPSGKVRRQGLAGDDQSGHRDERGR